MVSFVYTPVECPFYKFYGINCRPKSSAKLLDRFFHRRRQVSPIAKYLTHCFFDGYYHLLDGNLAVSFQHGLATHFEAARARWRLASCVASQQIHPLRRLSAAFVKPQYPNGIVSSVSFVHHEHREERGRLRRPGMDARES
jgi:hypothetical protein